MRPKKFRKKKGAQYPVITLHGGYEPFTWLDVVGDKIIIKDQWLMNQGVYWGLTRQNARKLARALLEAVEDTKS